MSGRTVKVPPTPGPSAVLCYATPPLDGSKGNPMLHCDRKHGHGGRHSWELAAELAGFDASHVRALVFRINRADQTPTAITDDEHHAVLREARDVLEALAGILEVKP